jgi:hypothetical protein
MVDKKKKSSYIKYSIILIVILVLFGAFVMYANGGKNVESNESDAVVGSGDKGEVKVAEDGTKYIVDPAKIRSGGPPKGGIGVDRGIPALDAVNINFVSVSEADEWIEDNELVLAMEHKGAMRVYPLQILVWHEIANDEIAGDPFLITYCPLCGSGIAYERTVEVGGKKVETRFGTSGKLYNSNLIMYDEETDTYWQQIDGLGIVGELTGQELREVSIDTVVWSDWKVAHPESEVLSKNTGMSRNYGKDPYGSYYEDSNLFFPVENQDDRIHAKDFVFGVEVNGAYKAYRQEDIERERVVEDVIGGVNVRVERMDDGRVTVTNVDNGEEIVKEVDFWFAWYAFHPETELYGF